MMSYLLECDAFSPPAYDAVLHRCEMRSTFRKQHSFT